MAIFDDGKTLDEVLSEDVYNQLSDIFEENGVVVYRALLKKKGTILREYIRR
ncbi:hypothetical protein [Oceanobacillus sp. 1P07AA]|uniref:hypothetical protein n=1 Tax=Oceanobacillus sp. 1P07AA TaxID=3132293 RepID=UPI0039A58BCC